MDFLNKTVDLLVTLYFFMLVCIFKLSWPTLHVYIIFCLFNFELQDNTTCRSDLMFWGYKEKCYKFGNAVTSGNLHAAECFKDDSLPFLPENDHQLIAILRQMVPTFKQNISVFIGTSNRYVIVEIYPVYIYVYIWKMVGFYPVYIYEKWWVFFRIFRKNKSNKGVHMGCLRNIKLVILSHFNT